MNERTSDCGRIRESIWSAWPSKPEEPSVLEHAASCRDCGSELEALLRLGAGSPEEAGSGRRAPGWSRALPEAHWARLAKATLEAATENRRPAPRAGLVPVFAAAVAAILLLARSRPARTPEPSTAELAQLEVAEHLELLEDWELLEAMMPDSAEPL